MNTNAAVLFAVLIGKTCFVFEVDPPAKPSPFEEADEEVVIVAFDDAARASLGSEARGVTLNTLSDINTFGVPAQRMARSGRDEPGSSYAASTASR